MKKILLPICAMLLCMTACKKDNDGILRLEIEQYTSDSKAHLDQNYAVWDSYDQVKLNDTNYDVIVSGNKATISGVHSGSFYSAIYPAKWVTDHNQITYPAVQTYRENSNGKQIIDAPMGAYSEGSEVLKFHNLGSILAVNVTGVSRVWKIEVISNNNNVKINGNYTYDTGARGRTRQKPSIKRALSNAGTDTTTLICDGVSITEGDTKTFYIAMPPIPSTSNVQLTIKVYDDSYCYSRSQTQSHTWEANHGYNAPFNASECSSVQYAPLPTQIWYTASSQISNTFLGNATQNGSNGHYVATFANPITSIPVEAFYNKNVTSVTLPASVTVLSDHSFQYCDNLTSISMPGVTEIGAGAFDLCPLDSLYLPNVVTLNVGSFYSTTLRAVYLPKISTIRNYAFRNCRNLAHIYSNQTTAPSIGAGESGLLVFENVPATAVLHLPHGCTTRWDENESTILEGWPGGYAYDL